MRYPVLRYPDLTELQRLYEESPGPDKIVEVRLQAWVGSRGSGNAGVQGTLGFRRTWAQGTSQVSDVERQRGHKEGGMSDMVGRVGGGRQQGFGKESWEPTD